MTDKAVSTEDLCAKFSQESGYLGIVRLEAILNTLVDNKIESWKNTDNRKSLSVQSSPKTILHRLRFTSSPSISATRPADDASTTVKRKPKLRYADTCRDSRSFKKTEFKPEVSISSGESHHYHPHCHIRSFDESIDDAKSLPAFENIVCIDENCPEAEKTLPCYCRDINNGPIRMQYDEDYISLKIDGYGDDTDTIIAEEALRRARRKRRRRRKRRMKKRLAMNVMIDPVHVDDRYKVISADDLPQRARWTIVATACILLFMCLLLVGITLRMAPLIDDLVRKENEELLNSLQSGTSVHNIS